MIRSMISLRVFAVWMLLAAPSVAQVAPADSALAEGTGVVQELDFGAGSMVIDGLDYDVALEVRVEIAGSHGAFTMLRPGMRVRYEFLQVSESERRVVLIQELPANVELDQA